MVSIEAEARHFAAHFRREVERTRREEERSALANGWPAPTGPPRLIEPCEDFAPGVIPRVVEILNTEFGCRAEIRQDRDDDYEEFDYLDVEALTPYAPGATA